MRYRIIAIAGLLSLSGCANWPEHQRQQSDRYIGKPYDALFAEYGTPVGVAPTSDGGRFAEFQTVRNGYICNLKAWITPRGLVREVTVGGQNGCITPL